jgi:hypothetical protein
MKRCSCGFLKYLCRFRKREGRCVALSRMVVNPYSVVPSAVIASWGTNYKYYTETLAGIARERGMQNQRVISDGNGNTYFAACPSVSDFDYMGSIVSSNSGNALMTVNKLDSLGNRVWTATGTRNTGNSISVTGLTFDSNNRLVICGGFIGVDTFTLGSTNLSGTGTSNDSWFARLNTDGTWHSARSFGSNQTGFTVDQAHGICADGSGNIYVTGLFVGSLTIDGTTITNASTTAGDIYIAKFNSSNSLVWLKALGSAGTDWTSIVCDSSGTVYLGGGYPTGGFTVDSVTLPAPTGTSDAYVMRINATTGVAEWAARITSAGSDFVQGIDISSDGQSIVVGGRSGGTTQATTLTSTNAATITLAATGNGSTGGGYVAKLNSSGIWQWGTRIAATGGVEAYSTLTAIKYLKNDSIAVGGTFGAGSTLTLGSSTITANTNGSLSYDGYLSVFNSSGVAQWGTRVALNNNNLTSARDEFCSGIAQLDSTQIIATYHVTPYTTPLTLGGQTINATLGSSIRSILVKQRINATWEV